MPITRVGNCFVVEGALTPVAQITISLQADGRYSMWATFLGGPDSSYAPFSPEGLASEVEKLRKELEERTANEKSRGVLCISR